jgi:hypothetical protein
MAEFKLGRIRFIWKNVWAPTTTYLKDDVVRNGGKTYVCVIGHTSAGDFYTDLDNIPTRWNLVSDGTEWKGDWNTSTFYKLNDLVKYGGNIYLCNDSHTSAATTTLGLETDSLKWDLFAEGFDWKTDWDVSTRYKINDVVKYGGQLYICNNDHTSAATLTLGLEDNLLDWDIYGENFNWTGEWTVDTRYRINDVVKYGGQLYVCNVGHTSASTGALGLEADQLKWDYFNKGIEFKQDWAPTTRYKINDIVKYGAELWICTTYHTSGASFDETKWYLFVEGLEFENSWDNATVYQPGDVVTYGGYAYISKTNHTNQVPTSNSDDWDLFTTGFKFQNDWSGATAYKVGDVVRVNGYTYVAIADGTNHEPPDLTYWSRLNSGIEWQNTWAGTTAYQLGDTVKYGSNSYICINPHTSSVPSRPDNDTVGTYWNLVAAGNEVDVLTTQGDLVYFGGAGPTRLPIGADGQVLTVNNDTPEWKYFGVIEQVYYVATSGTDGPAPQYGITLDQPWKTVRYAAQQIEKGAKNPVAKNLLINNRIFIQKEVIGWIDAQIVLGTGIWSGFTYNSTKCERDVGYVIDALIYDISHSGNIKTREAALAYVNGSYTLLGTQDDQDVAGYNYMLDVIEAVLTNVAPSTVYNVDVTQYTGSQDAETGVITEITGLVGIINAAITAGNSSGIPAALSVNYTIFVKTGTFYETLPIIVPANTAIVGDELRSTNIRPAGNLISLDDKSKSVEAYQYIQSITADIISGTAITPMSSATQNTNVVAGSVGSSTAVTSIINNTNEIIDIVDNGLGSVNAFVTPDPTGYDTGYFNARRLLNANKSFLVAEISAWINAQIAANASPFIGFVYGGAGQIACERDVGYIVDALSYDLTYGGNLETLVAATSYYSLGTFVETGEKDQALAVQVYLKSIIDDIVTGVSVPASAGNSVSQDVSGTPGSAGAATFAQARVQDIYDTINTGTAPSTIAPDTSWVSASLLAAYTALQAKKTEIQSDCVQFVKANYPTLVFDQTICSRDVGYIVDALGYDLMFGSNFRSIKSGMSYHRDLPSLQVVMTDQLTAHLDMLNFLKYKAKYIAASGAEALADALWNDILSYMNGGNQPPVAGTNYEVNNNDIIVGAYNLLLNKDFLAEEAVAYINDAYPAYSGTYNEDVCKRDAVELIEALAYDLIYTGNYKSVLATRYYRNAYNVSGSIEEDMFYVRNGTGLRNMTIQGLTGTLGPVNSYGTKRPTAGSFVSLDPGFGPNHIEAWITNRSPYVQNVTTFGTACIGLKVDGALHNGGNDSVVANDFTQILSDGIGAWVTNLGRAELVSVFSYYGHIGYLAENGGKIRATNGNSSYGTYGCVSEGVDPTEEAITASVNNRAVDALIGNVVTSGSSIYRLEYSNAGINYNSATFTINGSGLNATAIADEFRDDAVFEVRLTDTGSGTGGENYVTASNVAQAGTTTAITLAATDNAISTAYVGMRILIISGTGVGQYGYVQSYNAGSKIAQIRKESDGTAGWDHVVPGTPIVTNLDLTTSYIIEPRVTLTAPAYAATAQTQVNQAWSDVEYGDVNTTFANVLATGGIGTNGRFAVVKTGIAYSITLYNGGTGFEIGDVLTLAGTDVGGASPLNDVSITVTNVSLTGVITNFSYTGQAAGGKFVAVSSTGNASQYSVNGTTWTSGGALPSGTWNSLAYGKVSGTGTWVAVSNGSTATAKTTDGGAIWTSGGALTTSSNWTDVAAGNGYFVAISNNATTTNVSSDGGANWIAGGALPAGTWTSVAYGPGIWVAVGTNVAASSANNGTLWTVRTIASASWQSVTWGNGRFVAVATGGTSTAYSLDGITWYAGGALTASASWNKVSYGQGIFAAVATGSTDVINTSEDGLIWTSRSLSGSAAWKSVAFGNPNSNPIWAVITTGTTTANSVVTGATAKARCKVVDNKVTEFRIVEPGSGYTSAPTLTLTDPNNTSEATWTVRTGNGVLANPTFTNRGSQYATSTATVDGNGTADIYQTGSYLYVKDLSANPVPGSNIQFDGDPNYYKLVTVTNFVGSGPYTARFQISPPMEVADSPAHNTDLTIKIKYSQVRLTGHDFLEIGTGNFASTNYPGIPAILPIPENETIESGGGRVFYTSTDQDGNFRVGTLFSVEQATGVATLNADAFNIAGLNELTLGAVALGGSGATITEFSTDPFFTADSDSIIPTQRAIKAYISSQIGGGGSSLNVNTLTAGVVYVAGDYITTTTGVQINVLSKMNFTAGIDGSPVAMSLFLQG